MAVCKSCGAPVRWERTAGGHAIPLDPQPRRDGNLVVVGGQVVNILRANVQATTPRFVAHFVTCPNAASHRKARS